MTEPLPVVRPTTPSPDPIFRHVAIIGVGLIGGSLGMAVRRQWPSSLVIGVDRKDVIERAMTSHIIDVGADDVGMVSDADLIVLAAPVRENERLLKTELASLIPREAQITDVGSTKRGISAASVQLPPHLKFIGGHPIAGAAAGGLEHARPDLFSGRPWILCPTGTSDWSRLRAFVSALGARCVAMSPEQHDRTLAFLSHLPQLSASALMHIVGEATGDEGLALAGKGLQDSTRLASSPSEVWKDVCASNADNLAPALDALIRVLQDLRDDLDRGDALERIFRSAQDWKARLDRR
jgi:prephenate dehydrogenase